MRACCKTPQDLPKDVVFAKRLLGRAWSDAHIQGADHRLWSYTVIRSSWNKPLILGALLGVPAAALRADRGMSLSRKHLSVTGP